MNEQEKKRGSHLIILLCYTFFTIALLLESILLGWDVRMSRRLLAGLVICWILYIRGSLPKELELRIYFILMAVGFIFYGSHETSLFDLAPVIIVFMMIFCATEVYSMIWFCVALYLAVVFYGILFAFRASFEITLLSVTRLLLHSALVFTTAYMIRRISERQKNATQNLKDRIAELEESNRRTEDFLTNVSHELRTPINAVTGLTSVMLKNETDRGKRENLLSVQKAGHRLFGQIEDILDYTEIDTGRLTASEDTYMLSSLINDMITERDQAYEASDLEIIFDVDAGIPAVLSGDGRKIKKIIRHLLDNAVKFTKQGGVYVRIYALPKSYGVNLCIQVTDTGIGVDAGNLARITERFYQSSRGRDRTVGGLGLGLPIVYGMTAAMEGFVHIESQTGKGTTVTVSIPQKIEDPSPGMTVRDQAGLCIGCYLMPEKYKVPEVRKFYDEMLTHLAEGLGVTVHRVFDQDGLKNLVSTYRLTHLFLGREEYEQDPDYFEGLDEDTMVIVVAERDFAPPDGSRVKIIPKPFYCFPVTNVLNLFAAERDMPVQDKRMICPGVRVLVVDDEPMNRIVAEGIFKDYQMEVVSVASGKEAIEICGREEFDILFIDHMMPEMDGVETLRQIYKLNREQTDPFTAVAFTANAVSGAREMFLREGFDDFLSKPVEIPELEHMLKKVLPKSRIKYIDRKEKVSAEQNSPGKTDRTQPEKPSGTDRQPHGLERLKSVGFNIASGLNYCRNDEEFYRQLLTKFVSDAPQKMEKLNSLYDEKDYEDYRIQVHSLKSTAKMIGADMLSQTAKELEDAAKESDALYIRSHHRELLDEYKEHIRLIAETVGEEAEETPTEAADDLAGTDEQELAVCLKTLKDCLMTYEADKAQSILEKLDGMAYRGTPLKELAQKIKKNVEEYEFEAAADETTALIERMEGGEAE